MFETGGNRNFDCYAGYMPYDFNHLKRTVIAIRKMGPTETLFASTCSWQRAVPILRETLQVAKGDIRDTMAMLGLPRNTLHDKLGRHGIDPNHFRSKMLKA